MTYLPVHTEPGAHGETLQGHLGNQSNRLIDSTESIRMVTEGKYPQFVPMKKSIKDIR